MNNKNIRATIWKRLFNFIIDGFASMVLSMLILQVLLRINANAIDSFINSFVFQFILKEATHTVYLYYPLIYLLYYLFFESVFKTTLGKRITKTRVLTIEGTPIKFKHSLIRSLCRFIPLEQFTFLFIGRAGLHDLLSRTSVYE